MYVCNNTKESVAEKGDGGGYGAKEVGYRREKWLVGEDAGGREGAGGTTLRCPP